MTGVVWGRLIILEFCCECDTFCGMLSVSDRKRWDLGSSEFGDSLKTC